MGYRNLFLLNPARVSVKNEQLVVEGKECRTVPLEDIECIVADSLQTTFTAYALSKCAECRVTVFFSNEAHLPSGVLLPFCSHSRHLSVLERQLALSRPAAKRLWAQIVTAKIQNQAEVLKLLECPAWEELSAISRKVKSGDSEHQEAVAAALYFRALFGPDFVRNDGTVLNAFLNYGYAIFRSTVAKQLCAYGFEPSLGLFHHSQLNSFNLADDVMEPYRPVVDLYTAQNASDDLAEFTGKDKAALLDLLNMDVEMGGSRYAVSYAVEKTVQSLSSALSGEQETLLLPELLPLSRHRYE